MQKVFYKQEIEGVRLPSFRRNGSSYSYDGISVFVDRSISSDILGNIETLEEDIEKERMCPSIPVYECFSIHGLGLYKVLEAEWKYDKTKYFDYIKNVLDDIAYTKDESYAIESTNNKRSTRIISDGDFITKEEYFRTTLLEGRGFSIFMEWESDIYLVNLIVYRNGTVKAFSGEKEWTYTMEEVKEMLNQKILFYEVDEPKWINCSSLGKIKIVKDAYLCKSLEDKKNELQEEYDKLNEKETASKLCMMYYVEYLKNPIEFYREEMKKNYEKIPEHQRRFLTGDQDIKDYDIRRIIYHPEIKREV